MFPRSGATSNAVVAATSNAVAYPATRQAGDLLVLVAVISNNPTVGADPTGFAVQAGLSSSAATLTVRCYLRIADGTESGSATVTWTGAQNCVAAMVAISGYTGAGSIVIDPTAVTALASGAVYGRSGLAVSLTGKDTTNLTIFAGTNTTGTAAITTTSQTKIAEVYGGTTPFLGLAIACGGVLQPGASPLGANGVDTRTTTANYTANFGVQLPYATTYAPIDIPGPSSLDAKSPAYTITPLDISAAPSNLEYAVYGAGTAAWPTSGQGWPRIKQG